MDNDPKATITSILNDPHLDSNERIRRIFPLIHAELLGIARQKMTNERANHTLEPSALVNEAYLKLIPNPGQKWSGKAHFFAAVVEAMRRILIDHARGKKRSKRGRGAAKIDLEAAATAKVDFEKTFPDFVALDEAICRLEKIDPRMAQVVRLRFYAGLSIEQTAELVGVSERTVKNDWSFARAWLAKQLGADNVL